MFCGQDVIEMETKKMEKITEAVACVRKATEWFGTDMAFQPALTAKMIGEFEVRLVWFVHGFTYKTRPVFPSIHAICIDFAKQGPGRG